MCSPFSLLQYLCSIFAVSMQYLHSTLLQRCRTGAAISAGDFITETLSLLFDLVEGVIVVLHVRKDHAFFVVVLAEDLVVTEVELVANAKPATRRKNIKIERGVTGLKTCGESES